ncbi:L-threonine O-3-phosphate decarboxylase [Litoreibacter ascidiaceicola]|uniref:Aminotransferase n=1 Tax=Litoreibacter ascidiaceicola TaxID=1486859 RepID=A0A1M5ALI4_9RHOB|nr:threonine-phosphate decarboxylase [Litoreibacter ascidiaceicola]SHF31109.1 L-threonine O-3-phosphate decarboxylase [Litoreibacter ascidiaceicola]
MNNPSRDHGGGLDAAVAHYGGSRAQWLDLSTGINPVPYPIGTVHSEAWTALPDRTAHDRIILAARRFWDVPDEAEIIAAAGASALIARAPHLFEGATVTIPTPTYNEHAAAFRAAAWTVRDRDTSDVTVLVHPNNPDGQVWRAENITDNTIIDESFCDVMPEVSHVADSWRSDRVVLKSFGKFWGLAGLRLGFAIAHPATIERLGDLLGPWAVSGPALEIGARALEDLAWADATRARLSKDAARLDTLMAKAGAKLEGGTTLFRLYDVGDAAAWQDKLAQGHVWSRIFPYSDRWLRLGLPAPDRWDQLEAAL